MKNTLVAMFMTAIAWAMAFFGTMSASAAEITLEQARKAAMKWAGNAANRHGARIGGTVRAARTHRSDGGEAEFHVLQMEGGGFLVTSADDRIEPVIAFAEDEDLIEDPANPLYAILKEDLASRMTGRRTVKAGAGGKAAPLLQSKPTGAGGDDENVRAWRELLEENGGSSKEMASSKTSISDTRVSPLLSTKWGQGTHGVAGCYNYYTPYNSVCGCVATAFAQIMRYHRYPTASLPARQFATQYKSASYPLSTKSGTFDWANMPYVPASSPSLAVKQAIGKLTYNVGVASKMDYNSLENGVPSHESGAIVSDAIAAMTSYFNYVSAVQVYSLSSGVMQHINNSVLANLDHGMPTSLSLGGTGGHCVVADGYGYNSGYLYVHVNLGWSGNYNVWYNLPTVVAGTSTFNVVRGVGYNIFPTGSSGEIISGRILNSSGSPVNGALVYAYTTGGAIIASAISNSKGIYALRVSSSASYDVKASLTQNSVVYAGSRSVSVGKSSNNGTPGNRWGQDVTIKERKVKSISISGDTRIISGESRKYTCTATFDDGSTATVTPKWEMLFDSDLQYATIKETTGKLKALSVPALREVVIWAYYRSGTSSASATFDVTISPAFDAVTALDNKKLTFASAGDMAWTGQAFVTSDGVDAMRSGPIGDGQYSALKTTVVGPGRISFKWYASCEGSTSSRDYDVLSFTIDGERFAAIGGTNLDWEEVSYEIPAGEHQLKWKYAKDSSVSKGDDAGYLDQVVWTEYPEVRFRDASLTVSEDASFAEVVVQRPRRAPGMSARIHYRTLDGSGTTSADARAGMDYESGSGLLSWSADDYSDRTIRVKLIPDLVEGYDGSKRFRVELYKMIKTGGSVDYTCVGNPNVCTIKIKETLPPETVTIAVVDQPLSVEAGHPLTVRLARTGGSGGRVAVQVKTQDGTAVAGREFDAFSKVVVWDAGDSAPKDVTIVTRPRNEPGDLQFNVKLTALNTDAYADCITPSIPERKAYIRIVGAAGALTFEELQAAALARGVSMSCTGNWFVNAYGTLLNESIAPGGSAKMRFTVTGPGLLLVHPYTINATETCQVGTVEKADCTDSGALTLAIPEGEQTVTFKAKPDGNDVGMAFFTSLEYDSGLPFVWLPASGIRPRLPFDGMLADSALDALSWSAPPHSDDVTVQYRVRIGTKAKASKIQQVLADGIEECSCALPRDCRDPGRTYYWMIDYSADEGETWMTVPAIWSFTVAAVGTPRTESSSVDAEGEPVEAGKPVNLVQGVYTQLKFGAECIDSAELALVGGGLPKGMQVKPSTLKVKGVPSKAKDYSALLQVRNASGAAAVMMPLEFHVEPLGSGAGTFYGTLVQDDFEFDDNRRFIDHNTPPNGRSCLGSLTFSATVDGAISAKATVAGRTYVFESSTGYDEVREDAVFADDRCVRVTLRNQEEIGGRIYGNTLTVTVELHDPARMQDEDGCVRLGAALGEAKLILNLPDVGGTGVIEDVYYECQLFRDNADMPGAAEALDPFKGYYTVALRPDPEVAKAEDGVPTGNGYLTMTVKDSGKVKMAGRLPDGTAFSMSSRLSYNIQAEDEGDRCAVVPVYFGGDDFSWGGLLELSEDSIDVDGLPCRAAFVESCSYLKWRKDGKRSSYDRSGFDFELLPAGGWYNTICNIQTYYLGRDFHAEAAPLDALPSYLLPAGFSYSEYSVPTGVDLDLSGNSLSVVSRTLVADVNGYDLERSVNPWKVKANFDRATGLITGTFRLWDASGSVQIGTYEHFGVHLMTWDKSDEMVGRFGEDLFSLGTYLIPVTSKWTLSLPFNLKE